MDICSSILYTNKKLVSNVKMPWRKARSAKKSATEPESAPVESTTVNSEPDSHSATQETVDGKATTGYAADLLYAESQRIATEAFTKIAELHKWIAEAADKAKADIKKTTDFSEQQTSSTKEQGGDE